jgi:uncharacterized protein YjdB
MFRNHIKNVLFTPGSLEQKRAARGAHFASQYKGFSLRKSALRITMIGVLSAALAVVGGMGITQVIANADYFGITTRAADAVNPQVVYTKLQYSNSSTAGNGSIANPYNRFEDALEKVADGGTIYIVDSGFINTQDEAGQVPFTINKSVTIAKASTSSSATLTVRAAGIILGGDVTFKDITLTYANKYHDGIYANGYNLTLENVAKGSSGREVDIFAGSLYKKADSGSSSTLMGTVLPGKGGTVTITGSTSVFGNVFGGSMNGNFDGSTKIVIGDGVTVKEVYASGADEVSYNMQNWFDVTELDPPVGNANLTVSGTVSIDLNSRIVTKVDGAGATTTNVTYTNTSEYRRLALTNLSSLTVKANTNLVPTNLTAKDSGSLALTIEDGATLDLYNLKSNVPSLASLTGAIKDGNSDAKVGGTLTIAPEAKLAVSGVLSGNTELRIGYSVGNASGNVVVEKEYLTVSKDNNQGTLTFTPSASQPYYTLSYSELKDNNQGAWFIENTSTYADASAIASSVDFDETSSVKKKSEVNYLAKNSEDNTEGETVAAADNTLTAPTVNFTLTGVSNGSEDVPVVAGDFDLSFQVIKDGKTYNGVGTEYCSEGIFEELGLKLVASENEKKTKEGDSKDINFTLSIDAYDDELSSIGGKDVEPGLYQIIVNAPGENGVVSGAFNLLVVEDPSGEDAEEYHTYTLESTVTKKAVTREGAGDSTDQATEVASSEFGGTFTVASTATDTTPASGDSDDTANGGAGTGGDTTRSARAVEPAATSDVAGTLAYYVNGTAVSGDVTLSSSAGSKDIAVTPANGFVEGENVIVVVYKDANGNMLASSRSTVTVTLATPSYTKGQDSTVTYTGAAQGVTVAASNFAIAGITSGVTFEYEVEYYTTTAAGETVLVAVDAEDATSKKLSGMPTAPGSYTTKVKVLATDVSEEKEFDGPSITINKASVTVTATIDANDTDEKDQNYTVAVSGIAGVTPQGTIEVSKKEASGTVVVVDTVDVDDAGYTLVDGQCFIELTGLENEETYIFTYKDATGCYNEGTLEKQVTVSESAVERKATTIMAHTDDTGSSTQRFTVTVMEASTDEAAMFTSSAVTSGSVTATVNGKETVVTLTEGSGEVTLDGLTNGSLITFKYTDPKVAVEEEGGEEEPEESLARSGEESGTTYTGGKYRSSTYEHTAEVRVTPTISAVSSDTSTSTQSYTFTVAGSSSTAPTGKVSVVVDGGTAKEQELTNGTATISLSDLKNTSRIVVTYIPTENSTVYNGTSNTFYATVKESADLTPVTITAASGNTGAATQYFNVAVTAEDGSDVNGTIKVTINGEELSFDVVGGLAVVALENVVNNQVYDFVFTDANGVYGSAVVRVPVTVLTTPIMSTELTKSEGSDGSTTYEYKVTLSGLDQDANGVVNAAGNIYASHIGTQITHEVTNNTTTFTYANLSDGDIVDFEYRCSNGKYNNATCSAQVALTESNSSLKETMVGVVTNNYGSAEQTFTVTVTETGGQKVSSGKVYAYWLGGAGTETAEIELTEGVGQLAMSDLTHGQKILFKYIDNAQTPVYDTSSKYEMVHVHDTPQLSFASNATTSRDQTITVTVDGGTLKSTHPVYGTLTVYRGEVYLGKYAVNNGTASVALTNMYRGDELTFNFEDATGCYNDATGKYTASQIPGNNLATTMAVTGDTTGNPEPEVTVSVTDPDNNLVARGTVTAKYDGKEVKAVINGNVATLKLTGLKETTTVTYDYVDGNANYQTISQTRECKVIADTVITAEAEDTTVSTQKFNVKVVTEASGKNVTTGTITATNKTKSTTVTAEVQNGVATIAGLEVATGDELEFAYKDLDGNNLYNPSTTTLKAMVKAKVELGVKPSNIATGDQTYTITVTGDNGVAPAGEIKATYSGKTAKATLVPNEDGKTATAVFNFTGLYNKETIKFTFVDSSGAYIDATTTYQVVISDESWGTETFVLGELADVQYDGKEHKLVPTITDEKTGDVVDSEYYHITYSTSDLTNAGKITVTVKGVGEYLGTKKVTYNITPIELEATSSDATKVYDGTALTNAAGLNVTGQDKIIDGEAEVKVTGSLTNAGTATNTIELIGLKDSFKASNYTLKTTPGTLTVTPREVTFESASATKAYDGSALTKPGVTVLGGTTLVEGEGEAQAVGSITNPGAVSNTIMVFGAGNYLASNYKFTMVEGTLEVTGELPSGTLDVTGVTYDAHVENKGWGTVSANGGNAGTVGEGLRMEAVSLKLSNMDVTGGITYRVHSENYGWLPWVSDGEMAGTEGEGLRTEAIQIALTGAMAQKYDVYYRVHVENYGWLDWVCNGALTGSEGMGLRMEGLEVVLVEKGTTFDRGTVSTQPGGHALVSKKVEVTAHAQNYGWMQSVGSGQTAGTSGEGLRLEALKMSLSGVPLEGSITYSAHVQNKGWMDTVADGEVAGSEGEGLRMEALKINLTGEVAEYYDVVYRVHVENIGWMDWVKNGEVSGTTGQGLRIEAVEVKLVQK